MTYADDHEETLVVEATHVKRCVTTLAASVLLAACANAPTSLVVEPKSHIPAGYTLAWADEFEGDALDTTKWRYDDHANARGWYNNELQYYSAVPDDAVRVEDGLLKITARREDVSGRPDVYPDGGGQGYISGRIFTKGLHDWPEGYFTVRAKLPCGKGLWPAIWMMGEGDWPEGGEIDIMEYVGWKPGVVHSNVHTPASVANRDGPQAEASVAVPDACEAFHDYAALVTDSHIHFYVDGREFNGYHRAGQPPGGWPFGSPLHILLNVAVGGDWGGKVDDAVFPATFEIDHVRVYTRR